MGKTSTHILYYTIVVTSQAAHDTWIFPNYLPEILILLLWKLHYQPNHPFPWYTKLYKQRKSDAMRWPHLTEERPTVWPWLRAYNGKQTVLYIWRLPSHIGHTYQAANCMNAFNPLDYWSSSLQSRVSYACTLVFVCASCCYVWFTGLSSVESY